VIKAVASRFQALLVVVLTALLPCAALADGWFFPGRLGLEAGLRSEAYTRTNETSLQDKYEESGYWFEGFLLLLHDGYVVDPRIGRYSIRLEPVYRIGEQTRDGISDDMDANKLNYSVTASVLNGAATWWDAHIGLARNTQVNDVAFGDRYDTDVTNNTLAFNWKNEPFPVSFRYFNSSRKEERQPLGSATIRRRDEDRDRILVTGRSSKMDISLEHLQVDDHLQGDLRDYEQNRANANHTFRWGRSSFLRTMLVYMDRSGSNSFENVTFSPTLELQHTDSVTSQTIYRYFNQKLADSSDDTTHDGSFILRHELYENLRSNVYVNGRRRTAEQFSQDEYAIGGQTNYRKNNLFGLSVGANLHLDLRVTDYDSDGGSQEVVDEPHIASYVNPIVLNQRFVDLGSIVVRSAFDGFIYSIGLDYEVRLFNGQFAEIRIIPNGEIADGEGLLISYAYELLPSTEFDTLSYGYSLSLGYKGFRLYHGASRSDNRQISEGFSYLPPDQRHINTGLEWSWFNPKWKVRLNLESSTRDIGDYTTDTLVFRQSLTWTSSPLLDMTLAGSQALTDSKGLTFFDPRMGDFELQNRELNIEMYIVEGSLNWRARNNLTVRPSVGAWKRIEENTPVGSNPDIDRLRYMAKLLVSWQIRKLYLDFRYSLNVADENGRDYMDNRVLITLRRKFL
jgi:hypothetical protein